MIKMCEDVEKDCYLVLGATNTHFVNCHGLHSDDHYTTAYDLYLIFSEFIKHDLVW